MSNRRNIHFGKWADFLNIAYSTRPFLPWEERVVSITFSQDCADNLAGLFGLFPKEQDEEFGEFMTMSSMQHQLVDVEKLQEYVMKANPHPGLFGRLNLKVTEGQGIFDMKFR